jgi:hypothetical protein
VHQAYSLLGLEPKLPIFHIAWDRVAPQIARTLCAGRGLCDNGALQMGPAVTCHGSAGTAKGGPPMSGTRLRPTLATYRDTVAALIRGNKPFGDVEDVIHEVADLTLEQKAALWLFAFSLRDPTEQQLDARAHLAAVQ